MAPDALEGVDVTFELMAVDGVLVTIELDGTSQIEPSCVVTGWVPGGQPGTAP
jgi:hypothetical protein